MSDAGSDAAPVADAGGVTGAAEAPIAEALTAETPAVGVPETGDAASVVPAPETDAVLLAAVDLARAALLAITPADTIGELVGHRALEDHVLSLYFDCMLSGYPGWHWTVSLSRIDADAPPFVLETELTPGDGALLAPDWVPWSERLADYRAAQEAAAAERAEGAGADTDDDDDLDEDDLDEDDVDELDDLDDEVDEDDLDGDHGDDVLDGIDFAEHDEEPDEESDTDHDEESDEEHEDDDVTGQESRSR